MASSANNNSSNPWFGISMALVGLIVGYGLASGVGGTLNFGAKAPAQVVDNNGGAAAPAAPKAEPADVDDDAVLGDENAKVTVIEFTDYQCPFCGRHFTQSFGKIKANYVDTGKVKYVVRDFPLSFHQFAQPAAMASECAHEQGKFWEMHDKLFSNQATWSAGASVDDTFLQYARDIKLNVNDFKDCMTSQKYKDEIAADFTAGSAAGVDGTPGFWVIGPDGEGTQISGAQPYENFAAAIDAFLN